MEAALLDAAEDLLLETGSLTIAQVADRVGLSRKSIARRIDKFGLTVPDGSSSDTDGHSTGTALDDRSWLEARYTVEKMSMTAIGRHPDVRMSRDAVKAALVRHGLYDPEQAKAAAAGSAA